VRKSRAQVVDCLPQRVPRRLFTLLRPEQAREMIPAARAAAATEQIGQEGTDLLRFEAADLAVRRPDFETSEKAHSQFDQKGLLALSIRSPRLGERGFYILSRTAATEPRIYGHPPLGVAMPAPFEGSWKL